MSITLQPISRSSTKDQQVSCPDLCLKHNPLSELCKRRCGVEPSPRIFVFWFESIRDSRYHLNVDSSPLFLRIDGRSPHPFFLFSPIVLNLHFEERLGKEQGFTKTTPQPRFFSFPYFLVLPRRIILASIEFRVYSSRINSISYESEFKPVCMNRFFYTTLPDFIIFFCIILVLAFISSIEAILNKKKIQGGKYLKCQK